MRYFLIALCIFLSTAMAAAAASFPVLPDRTLTPGASMTADATVICHRSTRTVRSVTIQEKRDVFAAYENKYGVTYPTPHGKFAEVDHLISLELGGSNEEKNLWPQPWNANQNGKDVGAHTKDELENVLHKEICDGKISVQDAQRAISTDWIAAYRTYIGPLPPYRK